MNYFSACRPLTRETSDAARPVTYFPPVQVYEGQDAFELVAEIPGADEQSTEVSIEKGVLTLAAKMTTVKPLDATLKYSEFTNGQYRRSFEISDAVDPSGIEASVTRGILTVRLPKAKTTLPQKVRVIAG